MCKYSNICQLSTFLNSQSSGLTDSALHTSSDKEVALVVVDDYTRLCSVFVGLLFKSAGYEQFDSIRPEAILTLEILI